MLTCQAGSVILETGEGLSPCQCSNRSTAAVLLCATEAARSRISNRAKFCKNHWGKYRERLKSLECRTPCCSKLVMDVASRDEERTFSARLREIDDETLSQHCMVCWLGEKDEATVEPVVDSNGVLVEGSLTHD